MIAGVVGGRKSSICWLFASGIATLIFFIMETSGFEFPNHITNEGRLIGQALLAFGMTALSGFMINMHLSTSQAEETELSTQVSWVKNLVKVLCHDISNPLTVIIARNQMIRKGLIGSDSIVTQEIAKIEKATQLVNDAAHHIQNITKSVRDLYGLEHGKRRIPLSAVFLKSAINEAILTVSERAETKNVQIEILPFQDIAVLAEPTALSLEVMANILSNAVKFSEPNAKILISVREIKQEDQLNPWVLLSIRDFGIGIPNNILKDIFQVGTPTSRTGTAGEAGTGFGMPIVKNYIEIMGGKIKINSETIESNPVDHGTECVLYLRHANQDLVTKN